MPKRRTEDAVHVVMTDHRITRRLEIPDPLRRRAGFTMIAATSRCTTRRRAG
jgi:hypothetical protein